jgi:hypothetical protein
MARMRLATCLLAPDRIPAPTRHPSSALFEPPPGPSPDLALLLRRADARREEWRHLISSLERLDALHGGDQRRVARAFADAEHLGEITRRLVSPAMSAEGFALWWLRVGHRRYGASSRQQLRRAG